MKVLQINGGVFGSTGNIMFGISDVAKESGYEMICFSPVTSTNRHQEPKHTYIKIGNYRLRQINVLAARITGYNGCFSYFETYSLLNKISEYKPDIIHLHNIHDSYVNIPMLFSYIKKHKIPVVWTLHDCWALTGHCTHFTVIECEKWKYGCNSCSQINEYPKSIFDNSSKMWHLKKKWFTSIDDMTIVTPSIWLSQLVKQSYLKKYDIKVINNGIDTTVFKRTSSNFRSKYNIFDKKIILGVTSVWNEKKGFIDFIELSNLISENYVIVLVGLNKKQLELLPSNMIGIERTQNQRELAEIYSASDVFVNLTYEDTYPTTNLEARACGLPIITYSTGGSPESAGENAEIVPCGNIKEVWDVIRRIPNITSCKLKNDEISKETSFKKYVDLYAEILSLK